MAPATPYTHLTPETKLKMRTALSAWPLTLTSTGSATAHAQPFSNLEKPCSNIPYLSSSGTLSLLQKPDTHTSYRKHKIYAEQSSMASSTTPNENNSKKELGPPT